MNKRKLKRRLKTTATLIVTVGVICGVVIGVMVLYYALQVPDISALLARRVSESTKIYDRTGEHVLYDVHGAERRTIIPWEEIPPTVQNATLAAEDHRFYSHHGFDIKGMVRAMWTNIRDINVDSPVGGSTITQQLVKNSLFGKEKTLARKIKELVFSIKIERQLSKEEILWMYLNQIPYGSTIYGIAAASDAYFGKTPDELTIAEAATLAALPKAPSYYSPYGDHLDSLMARKNYIIETMYELGNITEQERDEALAQELEILPLHETIEAPHFVIMVREYLNEKYGEDMVQNGGLRVVTTIDRDLQNSAEELATKYADVNEARYGATNLALVSADPRTGQILAMIGSRDYFDEENDGNYNVATALRQPGSAFKPFAYATAFQDGFNDSTILFDVKTEFNPSCSAAGTSTRGSNGSACYHPNNYSFNFVGPVTMRQALGRSLNIPAVKTLYLAGIKDTIETATNMGITTLTDPDRFGLALVLGGAEVRLVDMVAAYGVFANDGVKVDQAFILSVTAPDGRVLEEYKKKETRVLAAQVARMMADVMSDDSARAPVFGAGSALTLGARPVGAKTGTTQENRDAWTMGYTPSLVTGVWVGNNDNTRMRGTTTGVGAAAPLWNEFMRTALAGTPIEQFVKPSPVVVTKPMLNGSFSGPMGIHTILHYVDTDDPNGPMPPNPYQDPQYTNWEVPVAAWARSLIPAESAQENESGAPGGPLPSPVDVSNQLGE